MSFEDIVAVLGQAFGMELKVVQDTIVFEVASDDGSAKVQILLQDARERNLVLLSADLGEVPPEGAIAMSWRGAEGARKAAALGHDAIMCPHTECYFDYDQGLREDPAAYPWFSCLLPLERVYAFDPLAGIPPEQTVRILGAECCNWTEFTCNETELQWKMWPRTCALAEVLWTGSRRPGHADFASRMKIHRKRLLAAKVNCATIE